MNCATHPQNVANAYCRTCGKPLCPQCQHNVRGVIYCEDCLASRLGDVAPPPAAGPVPPGTVMPPPTRVPDAPSPGLAAFLGFIPGVGAMYNGQFGKAIAHLMIFIGLCWASNNVNEFFGLGIAFWEFYMVFDAYRTAHARELGLPAPQDPFGFETWWMSDSARAAQERAIATGAAQGSGSSAAQGGSSSSAVPVGAIVLIAVGVVALLLNSGLFPMWSMHEFWPIVLIALGVWMFSRRRERYNCDCQRCQTRGLMGPAILVTLGMLFFLNTLRGPGHVPFGKTSPILLIVIGAVLLARRSASDEGHKQYIQPPPAPPAAPPAPSAGSQGSAGTEVRNG